MKVKWTSPLPLGYRAVLELPNSEKGTDDDYGDRQKLPFAHPSPVHRLSEIEIRLPPELTDEAPHPVGEAHCCDCQSGRCGSGIGLLGDAENKQALHQAGIELAWVSRDIGPVNQRGLRKDDCPRSCRLSPKLAIDEGGDASEGDPAVVMGQRRIGLVGGRQRPLAGRSDRAWHRHRSG